MKKILLSTLTFIFTLSHCFSQDIITKKSGEEIQAKISEITTTQVKYNRFDNLNGPVYSIDKSEVLLIKYENGTKDVLNNIGKKISLCNFTLLAGSNTSGVSGLAAGLAYDAAKNAKDAPYYQILRDTLIRLIEKLLNKNLIFQYFPMDRLTRQQSVKPIPPDVLAKNNDIFACLSAKSGCGVSMGWKKKVNMTTNWEIQCCSGYKVKIKTYSVSESRQGMFPDTGDPKLEPVWLELQRENTVQFLEKFSEIMKKDKNMQ